MIRPGFFSRRMEAFIYPYRPSGTRRPTYTWTGPCHLFRPAGIDGGLDPVPPRRPQPIHTGTRPALPRTGHPGGPGSESPCAAIPVDHRGKRGRPSFCGRSSHAHGCGPGLWPAQQVQPGSPDGHVGTRLSGSGGPFQLEPDRRRGAGLHLRPEPLEEVAGIPALGNLGSRPGPRRTRGDHRPGGGAGTSSPSAPALR